MIKKVYLAFIITVNISLQDPSINCFCIPPSKRTRKNKKKLLNLLHKWNLTWQLFCINIFSMHAVSFSENGSINNIIFINLKCFLINQIRYNQTFSLYVNYVQSMQGRSKRKILQCPVIRDHISCFSVKQLKALCFKK